MKKFLVILNRPDDALGLLAAGLDILTSVGGVSLTVLAAREPPDDTILPTEDMLTDETRAHIRTLQRQWADDLHARFHDWLVRKRAAGGIGDLEVNWLDPEISVGRMIRAYASEADLIVIGFPQPHDSDQKRRAVHAAIFDSGRPVLFMPPGWNRPVGRHILLSWKDTPPCRRAFLSARPLLEAAADMAVLAADDRPGAPLEDLLSGLTVEHLAPVGSASPIDAAETILRVCRDTGRDLLVMGGYAHGKLYNHLVGSKTQAILERRELPTFMQH
jgi:nucleotide-binding universal stress UspA family protein